MAVLNSNPEILLRKRKDRDRKRLQKQEEARERAAKKSKAKAKKFVRAETLISNYKSNELAQKRVKNVSKFEKQKPENTSDVEEKLVFVIRIPNYMKGLKTPSKVDKILRVLNLSQPNTGVFVKLNGATAPLLKLIAPYTVMGQPSVASVRKLFQKRATVKLNNETVKLDTNQLVEDEFQEEGLVCIEDLIHELLTLSAHFKAITAWLMPFKLNLPVNGWGPQAKLARIQHEAHTKPSASLSGTARLDLGDIDKFIDEQN